MTNRTAQTSCQTCNPGLGTSGLTTANSFCPPCAKGKYSDGEATTGLCRVCPINFYQDKEQQSLCKPCKISEDTGNRTESVGCQKKVGKNLRAPSGLTIEAVRGRPNTLRLSWSYESRTEESSDAESFGAPEGFEIQVAQDRGFQVKTVLPGKAVGENARSLLLRFDRTPGLSDIAAYKNESVVWLLPAETYFKVRAIIAVPESQSDWSAPTFNWLRAHECSDQQFLNVNSADPNAWACEACPVGAACRGSTVWSDVRARKGWWRVPWSENNGSVFEKCPYLNDCLGYEQGMEEETAVAAASANASTTTVPKSFYMRDVHEGCVNGTWGVLCNACVQGYNRDGVTCMQCQAESFGVRVGLVIVASVVAGIILYFFRRRLKRRWRRLKPLWRDVLRVLSINVTFAQINSSLPSVIDVDWPPNFIAFVANFNIVNIDLMSLLGTNCISGFSFYASFIFMTMMPVGVAVSGMAEYWASRRLMVRRLQLMTAERKQKKEQEALHLLFKIADADNSGHIDPGELMKILQQLGWKRLDLDIALHIARQVGAKLNRFGRYTMTELNFVSAMVEGKLRNALTELLAKQKKDDTASTTSEALKHDGGKEGLTDANKLVRWTLTRQTMSNSLSGATQLLLLAHTPVSRKVFQYFHCNDLAGTPYLRADYRVLCYSDAWWQFLPLVLVVMFMFTAALPGVLSYYLWRHRKELYSTSVNQTLGWLYEPFVRGAEFWMVHDGKLWLLLGGLV